MRYHVLASDYDGTLALDGRVDEETLGALERLRETGRKLLLVTGRELKELLAIFPEIDQFEWVVAENGAILYCPGTREEISLTPEPPPEFVERLKQNGVEPISVGRGIVATWKPHEKKVLEAIRDLGLDLQVIFNKDAVMVLPAGVNKATGLTAALKKLSFSAHEVVGVGDAENDISFLTMCECGVAVSNALPAVKERADYTTQRDHGQGVAELIDRICADDLESLSPTLKRHQLILGKDKDDQEVILSPYAGNILIAGPSGSGKSTSATSFMERLDELNYQFCVIDPEGDYSTLTIANTVGGTKHPPTVEEIVQALSNTEQNLVVNLIGLPLADRPPFFISLLPRLQEMRASTGRPHWLIVDEAHHLLPASWKPGKLALPQDLHRMVFITVHPQQIVHEVLESITTVFAIGDGPADTIGQLCEPLKLKLPKVPAQGESSGEIILWERETEEPPRLVKVTPGKSERRRHTRKYAEGELSLDRSFYFQGPEGKMNLRAQNLILFLQLSDGVDDATWEHHFRAGDYSKWFRSSIKDETMATEAEEVEKNTDVSAEEGRKLIREVVEKHYTLPASAPLPMPGTDAAPQHANS